MFFFFCNFVISLMQVGYTPDYLFLLQTILRSDPQVKFLAIHDTRRWTYISVKIWYCTFLNLYFLGLINEVIRLTLTYLIESVTFFLTFFIKNSLYDRGQLILLLWCHKWRVVVLWITIQSLTSSFRFSLSMIDNCTWLWWFHFFLW